jgi:hypothetical protein
MTELFSPAEIEKLSAEIDRQLQELRQSGVANYKSGEELEPGGALSKQKESIELVTKEPMESFLAKFGWAAKSELCDEKGMLNQQWQKYLDLDNKDALKQLGNVLIGMGFAKDAVSTLVVAAIVVIGRIGLKAFCKDYGNNNT